MGVYENPPPNLRGPWHVVHKDKIALVKTLSKASKVSLCSDSRGAKPRE